MLIHLIQREKKRVVEFPSLMFVRRIPYQSVRRRRIRHWCAAADCARRRIALIVAAFARPFFRSRARLSRRPAAARAKSSSCSTSRRAWATAITGPRAQRRGAHASSAASAATIAPRWCCSTRTPKRTCARPRTARASRARSNAAKVGSGATRYGPALKLAESILSRSPIKRREAVLISDFQRSRLERVRGGALPRRT